MRKNPLYSMVLFVILVGALGVATRAETVEAGGTIYIRANGEVEGTDKILRDGNIYTFTDNINDSIVVQKSNIIIDGSGYSLEGPGSWSSVGFGLASIGNVTIKDTNIDNFIYGIYLNSTSQTTISRNNITNDLVGIYTINSFGSIVSGNLLTGGYYGIHIHSSDGNTVSGNNITNNTVYGIKIVESSFNNTVTLNNMTNNYYGVYINTHSFNNTISSNNIRDNSGYGIVLYTSPDNNIHGNNLANNDIEVYLGDSFDNMVFGNTMTAGDGGLFLEYSSNNTISGNIITKTSLWGNQLLGASNNTISGNNITNNPYQGIWLRGSSNNKIYGNDITDNLYYGINFWSSSNNFIYNNDFVNNTNQAKCSYDSVNTWDNCYPSGGNYWSDYAGVDLFSGPYQNLTGSDFIGDTPYFINSNNKDRYPLMIPYETEPPTISVLSPENKTYSVNAVPLTFTVDEATSWIGYSLDGQANVTFNENTTLSNLADGPHYVVVYANDAFGNMGASSTVCFIVDTASPTISVLSPENKTYVVGEVSLTFTVSESTSWMGYSLDGQINVTISGNTTLVDLSDGAHTMTVYANDTVGNMGHSVTVYFTVDTVTPNIEILSPENGTYTTSSVSLSFTVDEATSWIGYSLDGQANITIAGNTTLTELSNGMHSLVVYASDMAENLGFSGMVCFTIDTTPPSISIVSPENKTYDITDIPLTFTVDKSVLWMAYSLDGQTNVTITGNTTLSGLTDGSHTIIVYANDTAGNTGSSEMVYFSIESQQLDPQSDPESAEPLQLWIVAIIVAITVVGAVLLVHFAKVKKTTKAVK